MSRYFAQRLIFSIPTLMGVLFFTFVLSRFIPGDPCRAQLGERATDTVCNAFVIRYRLDEPLINQFAKYVLDCLHWDFGISTRYGLPVNELIISRFPVTLEMGFLSFFFAVVLGTFLGVFAGARKGSVFDNVLITGTTIGGAVPLYWVGILLVYTFSVLLKDTPVWLPPSGRISPQMNLSPIQDIWGLSPVGFWLTLFNFISNFYIVNTIFTGNWKGLCDVVAHLFLPSLTLSIAPMSLIARMTRASVLEVFTHNYIQTAYAKGLSNLLVIYKHVAANALLPIITILGLSLGNLLSGTVLVETIFGLSGLGKTLYESVLARDYAVIQAFTLLVAIIVIFANMLADIAYTYLNPRVRL